MSMYIKFFTKTALFFFLIRFVILLFGGRAYVITQFGHYS